MDMQTLDLAIGNLLLKPDKVWDFLSIVNINHIPPQHRAIVEWIANGNGNKSLDQAVIHFSRWSEWLLSCVEHPGVTGDILGVAKALQPQLRKHAIRELLQKSIDELGDEDSDPDDIVAKIMMSMDVGENGEAQTAHQIYKRAIEVLEKKLSGQFKPLEFGIHSLDALIGGFWPGDLCVVAGRPGMGKTAFALTVALHIAHQDQPVGFFSLEMTAEQLIFRSLSALTGIPFAKIHRGVLEDRELRLIAKAESHFKSLPLFIVPMSHPSIMEIRRESIRLARGRGVKLFIIDYLQRVATPPQWRGQMDAAVGANTKMTKSIARDCDAVVILLSQLNRQAETMSDKRPSLHHLRDSGNIEQEADQVVFIYREDYYKKGEEKNGAVEFLVEKNRHGRTGRVDGYFDQEHVTFTTYRGNRDGTDIQQD